MNIENEIIKLKNSIDRDLKRKYDSKQKCEVDPKKFEKLKTKVATFLYGVNGYIKKKDALREQKGGNLGKNGEGRYEAMNEAYKSVYFLKQSIDIYENQGILPGDYDRKPSQYGVDPVAVKKYVDKKKDFVREDLQEAMGKVNLIYESEDKKMKDKGTGGTGQRLAAA